MRSIVPVVAALLLAACDRGPGAEARMLARQQALDPPRLWRIEALDGAGKVQGVSFVCADPPLSQTFARIHPVVDATPCGTTFGPVADGGWSTLRCRAEGRSYVFSSRTDGDPARDFRLAVTVTPLSRDLGPSRQVRRFQRLGGCPATWRVGDQADAVRLGRQPPR